MATIDITSPYSMKDSVLTLALEGDTADDYTASVSQAEFQPTTSTGTWTGIGGNTITDQGVATWVLALGLAQDAAPGGLLRFLFDNEGETATATLTPKPGSGNTMWTAEVILSPANIGGTASNAPVGSQVNLGVKGKPVPSTVA